MKKNQKMAENLLDWADELEAYNIGHVSITVSARLQLLVKDLHRAAGVLGVEQA